MKTKILRPQNFGLEEILDSRMLFLRLLVDKKAQKMPSFLIQKENLREYRKKSCGSS